MTLELEHFIGMNAIPQGAMFHPTEGNSFIYSSGATVVIGDLLDPHSQHFLPGHDDFVTCLAISKTGRLIASGQMGNHSDVLVWDYETKRVLYRFEEHDHRIQALAFSDDEKIVASLGCADDGNLILWDLSNGCIICSCYKLPPETLCMNFMGFMKDVKRRPTSHYQLITGGKDGTTVWDIDPFSGEMIQHRIVGEVRASISRQVLALAHSEDEEFLFAATTSGDYLVVSMRTMKIVQVVPATKMSVSSVVCHEDMLFVGCGDRSIKVYRALTGDYLQQVTLDGGVIGLSLSPDGLELLATTAAGTVARVNMSSLQHIVLLESHTKPIMQIIFDQGSHERFASVSEDGTIKVWDMTDYATISTATARREQEMGAIPLCLAFANLLFSGWSDGRVICHSAESGESLWMLDNAHAGGVTAMALSHNRRFIVTGGPSGEVRLWELRTRELISHLKEHKQRITSLRLLEDDTLAFSGSRDRCILRWDLRMEKRMHCHMQRMGGINDFVLSKDQNFLISVGQDRKLAIWHVHRNDHVFQMSIDGENDEGLAVAISNDGAYVVTGGSAGVVRLWSLALANDSSPSLRLVSEMRGHSKPIVSVVFSTNNKQVVSAGQDGSIFLWWFSS